MDFHLLNVVTLIVGAFVPLGKWLSFVAPASLLQPWTLLTYPLVFLRTDQPFVLWTYAVVCGRFSGALVGHSLLRILFRCNVRHYCFGMSMGALLYRAQFPVGNYLPLSALFIAWAMLNPDLEVRLYGIIPILAKWLALGTVLIIFFTHSSPAHPLFGFFALAGCAASYWWVRTRGWSGVSLYSSMPYMPPAPKKKKTKRTAATTTSHGAI
jgi:hypothetical protein